MSLRGGSGVLEGAAVGVWAGGLGKGCCGEERANKAKQSKLAWSHEMRLCK